MAYKSKEGTEDDENFCVLVNQHLYNERIRNRRRYKRRTDYNPDELRQYRIDNLQKSKKKAPE